MELNKENLLEYYKMKKVNIEEMRAKAKELEEFKHWDSQLYLIEALILELDLFN